MSGKRGYDIQYQLTGWNKIINIFVRFVIVSAVILGIYFLFSEKWFTLDGLNLWNKYLKNISFQWFAGYGIGFYYVFNKLFSKMRIFVDGYELQISGMNVRMKEVFKTSGKSILIMDGKSLDVVVEGELISDDPIIFQGLLGRKFNVEAIRDLFVDHEILRRNFAENVSGLTKKILEDKLKPQVKDIELWKPKKEPKEIKIFTEEDEDRSDDDGRIARRIRDVFKKNFRRERYASRRDVPRDGFRGYVDQSSEHDVE